MGRGRDVIWIFDAMTGARRVGVRFPGRFRMAFRAGWVDDGEALVGSILLAFGIDAVWAL